MSGLPPQLRAVSAAEVAERLEAGRSELAFLLYRDGEGRQRIVELGPEVRSLCIGRGPSCEIALAWDAEVSRVHATLERTGGVRTYEIAATASDAAGNTSAASATCAVRH